MSEFHNGQPSKLVSETLKQMGALRAQINRSHPGFLNSLRQQVFDLPAVNERGEELIDHQKNRQVIEKFLEIKAPSTEFKKQLMSMLADTKH